jgi:hypothetical protein
MSRNLILILGLIAVVVILVACAVVAVLGLTEIKTESYANYAEAEAAGLFDRGWVPAFVPRSAGAIAVTYDIDTNNRCSRVDLNPADAPGLQAALEESGYAAFDGELPALPTGILAPRGCPFRLTDAASGDIVLRNSGLLYDEIATIDTSRGMLYLWTTPSTGDAVSMDHTLKRRRRERGCTGGRRSRRSPLSPAGQRRL